jgi:hypothetical protein
LAAAYGLSEDGALNEAAKNTPFLRKQNVPAEADTRLVGFALAGSWRKSDIENVLQFLHPSLGCQ